MTCAKFAVAAIIILLATLSRSVSADQRFSCRGERIVPTGEPNSLITANLNLGPPLTVAVDGKSLEAQILSDNKIQLRFQTNEFLGEFFHYTGDLILIYDKLGHLARLPCSPG